MISKQIFRRTTLIISLATCSAAFADSAAIQRCRAVTDAQSRLACYDAIPLNATPAAAAPVRPAPPIPPVPVTNPVAEFGLEQQRVTSTQLPSLESSIAGRFEGWGPRSRITLTNGQVWQVMDDSSATLYLDNPKVLLRRGALGSFYLEIDGTNRSPKVKRLK
jgi:hypothetical protein